jgi:hypothetical protein
MESGGVRRDLLRCSRVSFLTGQEPPLAQWHSVPSVLGTNARSRSCCQLLGSLLFPVFARSTSSKLFRQRLTRIAWLLLRCPVTILSVRGRTLVCRAGFCSTANCSGRLVAVVVHVTLATGNIPDEAPRLQSNFTCEPVLNTG